MSNWVMITRLVDATRPAEGRLLRRALERPAQSCQTSLTCASIIRSQPRLAVDQVWPGDISESMTSQVSMLITYGLRSRE